MELQTIIKESLSRPKEELGDRTTYVGGSDLGCERKGCLEKLTPSTKSLETMIRFKRGDMVESILKDALEESGICFEWQYEAVHPQKPYLKAHLDFTFMGVKEIGVLESKSVSSMPGKPYDGWIKQLHYQMGLVALNHPQKHVKGAVIAMDVQTGNIQMFNGYCHSPQKFMELEASGDRIWESLKKRDLTDLVPNKTPLCSFCSFRADCPAFFIDASEGVVDLSPISERVNQYLDGKTMEKEGRSLAGAAKSDIIEYLGPGTAGKDGDLTIQVLFRNRQTLDTAGIRAAYPDLYEEFKKKTSYTILDVL